MLTEIFIKKWILAKKNYQLLERNKMCYNWTSWSIHCFLPARLKSLPRETAWRSREEGNMWRGWPFSAFSHCKTEKKEKLNCLKSFNSLSMVDWDSNNDKCTLVNLLKGPCKLSKLKFCAIYFFKVWQINCLKKGSGVKLDVSRTFCKAKIAIPYCVVNLFDQAHLT